MSGSKKGRKLRPYRTGPVTPLHVLLRTPEQAAEDERENPPPIEEWLNREIETCVSAVSPAERDART